MDNMSRPTIKQQREIALKSSKRSQRLPEIPLESPELPLEPPETPLESPELPLEPPEPLLRDKQVTVKFSLADLVRLKKIAAKKHRPVANLIYSVIMDFVDQSDTDGV
ncbi:hypothetical protein [Cylindrospermopsis raciborskii]|uniref:hypothetical protein n=1 Tax=Cylindrospermopsis raciborskii TaxID=77022 RepID=UPI0022C967EF|nr:hypothetical protein [Cylindrospermopsis raciborskii]MCZ2207882.1 hypothetical protein [Cylindrospermopsis raciborskii PAMP2011]